MMAKTSPGALLALLLLAPSQAFSACEAPYTTDNVLVDLMTIEDFLRAGDDAAASNASKKMGAGVPCLKEVLPSMIVGRVYRAIGGGMVAGGDIPGGMKWLRTAAEIENTFDYGMQDLPEGHVLIGQYSTAKAESHGDQVEVENVGFVQGIHYIDGRKISAPKARLERVHLYQYDSSGAVRTWLIDGNGFPSDVLEANDAVAVVEPEPGGKPPKEKKVKEPKGPKDPKAPKEKKVKEPKEKKGKTPQVGDDGMFKRQRPWEKTPLLIGGGAIIAGGIGVYYLSGQKRSEFFEAKSEQDLDAAKRATNQLFLASMGVFAAGIGTVTWGAILDGGAPVPAVNVRF